MTVPTTIRVAVATLVAAAVVAPAAGFDWADAGIGAGATLGLAIAALGAFALLATHSRRPRPTGA